MKHLETKEIQTNRLILRKFNKKYRAIIHSIFNNYFYQPKRLDIYPFFIKVGIIFYYSDS